MVSSVAPAVCSNAPYAQYLPLRDFAPAVSFCSAYQAASTLPPIAACPEGDALCSMLLSLSKCDRALISTACSCIKMGPTVTISVPTTMATSTASSKATEPSETDEPPETEASKTHKPKGRKTSSAIIPSSTTTPTCAVKAARPTPKGAICQKAGTINPGEWDMIGDGTATSVEDCACQCLNDPNCGFGSVCCQSFGFTPSTNDCALFIASAAMEGFVADASSPTIFSDNGCFQKV